MLCQCLTVLNVGWLVWSKQFLKTDQHFLKLIFPNGPVAVNSFNWSLKFTFKDLGMQNVCALFLDKVTWSLLHLLRNLQAKIFALLTLKLAFCYRDTRCDKLSWFCLTLHYFECCLFSHLAKCTGEYT